MADMWGIDVSHWTKDPYGTDYEKADFVITKLTNGASEYQYEGFGHECIKKTLADGKLSGAYHYACGSDPEDEARVFCEAFAPYVGIVLPAVDWERSTNSAWGDDTWLRRYVDAVHDRIGIYPMIYTGYEGAEQCRDCADDCALWYARYRDDRQPEWNNAWKTGAWDKPALWQYTSSGGDKNIGYLTADEWKERCKPMSYATATAARDAVLRLAESQVGYLEKKSNSDLDSKTGNAGSGNYTKYWRDLYKASYNGAWCQAFVDWCFKEAFGEKTARSLLHMETAWSFYTPTAASYFKSRKQWYTSPKRGDVIYFKNSERICHVGIVWKVSGSTVYTIEGNTSGASGVIANGGGVCKKSYSISSSYIAGYGRPNYAAIDGADNSVAQFERWANAQYPGTTKSAIGRLLNPTGKWAENDNDRLVALAIWKYIAKDDFGAKVTPGNRVYGTECRKAAAKMVVGYGYKEHPDLVRVLQGLLAGHGLYDGEIDGICGAGTCAGIQAAERKYGLTVDSSDAKKCSAGKQVWEALLKRT